MRQSLVLTMLLASCLRISLAHSFVPPVHRHTLSSSSPPSLSPTHVGAVAATPDTVQPETTANVHTERALEEHDTEVKNGRASFGDSSLVPRSKTVWKDVDFIGRSVGVGNAGPDEALLLHGDTVFQTAHPVFTKEECQALIDEARSAIAAGLEKEQEATLNDAPPGEQRSNSELGEARVSTLPKARSWLQDAMQEKLLPLLESRFGCSAQELTLQDALVIGYGYFGAPTVSQPVHRDSCLLSLNVALSPTEDYVGGGTYFEGLQKGGDIVNNEQGHVVCHSSGSMHAGRGIQQGERWVLVLFVLSAEKPQLARRCHAHGTQAKRAGDLDTALAAFETGLALAPRDHQLHTDLGGVYAARGDFSRARQELAIAHFVYPPCFKASIGLGSMMLEQSNRPRAALRWFEMALDRIGEADLAQGGNVWVPLRAAGWNARVNAAQCAIMCSSKSPALGVTFLPKAIDWIETALVAAPEHPMLNGMLMTANQLQGELP